MKFEPSWICFFQKDKTKGLYCAGDFDNVNTAAHCKTFIIRIVFPHLDADISLSVIEGKSLHNMLTLVRNIFLHN